MDGWIVPQNMISPHSMQGQRERSRGGPTGHRSSGSNINNDTPSTTSGKGWQEQLALARREHASRYHHHQQQHAQNPPAEKNNNQHFSHSATAHKNRGHPRQTNVANFKAAPPGVGLPSAAAATPMHAPTTHKTKKQQNGTNRLASRAAADSDMLDRAAAATAAASLTTAGAATEAAAHHGRTTTYGAAALIVISDDDDDDEGLEELQHEGTDQNGKYICIPAAAEATTVTAAPLVLLGTNELAPATVAAAAATATAAVTRLGTNDASTAAVTFIGTNDVATDARLVAHHNRMSAVDSVLALGGSLDGVQYPWELTIEAFQLHLSSLYPYPEDIRAIFRDYDRLFFDSKLGSVEVSWSKRMTLCAGLCKFQPASRYCSIRMSQPLLSLRPVADIVETLLHESIHALLFLQGGEMDRDGHGPQFQMHMKRINAATGLNVTIYHSFGAEVASFRQHHWRCDGSCRHKPPFYGLVKRAMNRAPGPSDYWHARHQVECGGSFTKVREPEGYARKRKKKKVAIAEKGAPSTVAAASGGTKLSSDNAAKGKRRRLEPPRRGDEHRPHKGGNG